MSGVSESAVEPARATVPRARELLSPPESFWTTLLQLPPISDADDPPYEVADSQTDASGSAALLAAMSLQPVTTGISMPCEPGADRSPGPSYPIAKGCDSLYRALGYAQTPATAASGFERCCLARSLAYVSATAPRQ